MSKKDKLLARLLSEPKDFTFNEAASLLQFYDYYPDNKGKTSGSRVVFRNNNTSGKFLLHKPHPRNELLDYQIKQLIKFLESEESK
ncbi:MAG: type II toxin-antitoxin system HicA family toxin [Eubacterium sp.]|jgi:hypothetical protein|nr:type II toxin-antitoxin system HicA family toxin [Eubacterium sp.]